MKAGKWTKVAAAAAMTLTMCGAMAGTSDAQTILQQTSGHPFTILAAWNFPDGLNPLEPNSLTGAAGGMIAPPLAWVSRLNLKDIIPFIASKWSMKGNVMSIWVNPKAKWSNGKPVTSADIKLSLELALYYDQWMLNYIGPIKVINSHEVQITDMGYPKHYFVPRVLGLTPVYAASEYAPLVPKNIYQLYKESNSPNSKINTAASNKLTAMYKNIEKIDPKSYLSCGPYILKSDSTSEALFVANPYFWKKGNFPETEILNSTNPNLEYAWANESRFTMGGIPAYNPNLVKEWLSASPYHKVAYTPAFYDMGINFNLSRYPYNMVQVRRALAYLINRKDVAHVADPLEARAVAHPNGMFDFLQTDKYLTAKQRASLNPYTYNEAKGVAMLKAAGFKKTASGWLMPNGKPFAPSIVTPSGYSSSIQFAAEVVAADLKKVGIKAKVYFPPLTVYEKNEQLASAKGYGMSIFFEAFSVRAFNAIGDALAYNDGISLDYENGTYSTTPGDIKLPLMPLPDGKKINIPEVAVKQDNLFTGSRATRAKGIWLISQAANYNLPDLTLYVLDKSLVYVDDQYYTGFPYGKTVTSPQWDWWIYQNFIGPASLTWMYEGWLHARKA
ncbi:MAG: ABC transporter substrate-binding protein [Firmicutes bacterium]|nr:ABC transporter substrate-binding protein [Bacillota bacterium]